MNVKTQQRDITLLKGDFFYKVLLWKELRPETWKKVKITETLRTLERQKYLKSIGATTILNSQHLTGNAFDICLSVDSYKDNNEFLRKAYNPEDPRWREFADEAKQFGIDWLFDLVPSLNDKPHFQNNFTVSYETIYKNMTKIEIPKPPEMPKLPDKFKLENTWINAQQERCINNLVYMFRRLSGENNIKQYYYPPIIENYEGAKALFAKYGLLYTEEQELKISKDDPMWKSLNSTMRYFWLANHLHALSNSDDYPVTEKLIPLYNSVRNVVQNYSDLLSLEFNQIANGEQIAVPEQEEASQK